MLWIEQSEINSLPNSGTYWNAIVSSANTNPTPHLGDKTATDDVVCLAKALVYRRNNDSAMRTSGISLLQAAMLTLEENEDGMSSSRSIAPSRNLTSYVIAAELLDLTGTDLSDYEAWLDTATTTVFDDGKTIRSTHRLKPNNWGTHAGAACAARAIYLNDTAEINNTIDVFKGWLGDRAVYSGFTLWGGLCWQSNPSEPVGINPPGATIEGHNVDGVLPDDQRRNNGNDGEQCEFEFPFEQVNYCYEALQGTIVTAVLLDKAGQTGVWSWSSQAIRRAYAWLYDECSFAATGDDKFQLPLVDFYLGTNYWAQAGNPAVGTGKNMAWTDWTHGLRIGPPAPRSTDRFSRAQPKLHPARMGLTR